MSTIRRITATLGATVALCVIGAEAASAAPLPSPATAGTVKVGAPQFADDFSVVDGTPFTLNLTSATQGQGLYGPSNGWFPGEYPSFPVVSPGSGSTWGITHWAFGGDAAWSVSYDFTDSDGSVDTVTMSSQNENQGETCTVTGPTASRWTCSLDGSQATLHASTAQMNLSPSDRNAFAQALSNVCSASSGHGATCTFLPTAQPTYTEGTTGFVPKGANTEPGCFPAGDPRDSYQYTGSGETSQTTSYDDSISESASVGIEGVADFGISHTRGFGQSFSSGASYSDGYTIDAPYGYLATPFWYPTIASTTGNFTATIGGTTYDLDGVTLRTAGVAGTTDGHTFGDATATFTQQPMTKAEWTQNCGQATPPPFLR